jgi:hypothetical protein
VGDRDWGVSVGGRLPKLLLKPDSENGEEGAVGLWMDLIGGLVEMRMLTSDESNIWRISFLQSVDSDSVEEVVNVSVVLGDGIRFDEGDDGEVEDGGGSVKYRKLGVFWMTASTKLSPSSFPETSEKMSEGEKG